ncbi:MAG: Bax inhibitor-1/YccA family protein [Candidatus Poseidonia sp.]|uniref:Bax inhibitor-1/YccA family membrane protein n=1 Tax=Poseidonia sp. TaxID=2666344 RepID=UPI0030C3DA48|nr:Bax inhibitor-1/YccA family protein [Poseidonia sp.]
MRAVSSTSNPVLSNNFWSNIPGYETMSYEGTMQKIGVLFGITILTALFTVSLGTNGNYGALFLMTAVGFIGGLVTALVMIFTRPKNPAPGAIIYALFEGMVVADPTAQLLTICENGYGKRTPFGPNRDQASGEEASSKIYRTQKRGGKGLRDIKATHRNGNRSCDDFHTAQKPSTWGHYLCPLRRNGGRWSILCV